MKRKEFIRQLQKLGCTLYRHGANHDIYFNPASGQKQPVPRHAEIHDQLGKTHQKASWTILITRLTETAAISRMMEVLYYH